MSDEFLMALRDAELIRILQDRGYIVRHKSEATKVLSWNRAEPIPEGVNFPAEAVEKIREQVSLGLIEFETRSDTGIRTARLRILA